MEFCVDIFLLFSFSTLNMFDHLPAIMASGEKSSIIHIFVYMQCAVFLLSTAFISFYLILPLSPSASFCPSSSFCSFPLPLLSYLPTLSLLPLALRLGCALAWLPSNLPWSGFTEVYVFPSNLLSFKHANFFLNLFSMPIIFSWDPSQCWTFDAVPQAPDTLLILF